MRNMTRKTCVAREVVVRETIWGKLQGLMFRRKIVPQLFIFSKEMVVSLHTFFVWSPIDVIFVNDKCRVVEVKEFLAPFSIYIPKKKARYVIELPAGDVKKSRTELNDFLRW